MITYPVTGRGAKQIEGVSLVGSVKGERTVAGLALVRIIAGEVIDKPAYVVQLFRDGRYVGSVEGARRDTEEEGRVAFGESVEGMRARLGIATTTPE